MSEIGFQREITALLNNAGFETRGACLKNMYSRRYSIPDICVSNADKSKRIAIECKMDVGQQSMACALGQCLIYQVYGYRTIICCPSSCGPESDAVMTAATKHQIDVCCELDIVNWVAGLLNDDGAINGPARYDVMMGRNAKAA